MVLKKLFAALCKTYPVTDFQMGSRCLNVSLLQLVLNIELAAFNNKSALQAVAASSSFGAVPLACYYAVLAYLIREHAIHVVQFWRRIGLDAELATARAKRISDVASKCNFASSNRKIEEGMFMRLFTMNGCYANIIDSPLLTFFENAAVHGYDILPLVWTESGH